MKNSKLSKVKDNLKMFNKSESENSILSKALEELNNTKLEKEYSFYYVAKIKNAKSYYNVSNSRDELKDYLTSNINDLVQSGAEFSVEVGTISNTKLSDESKTFPNCEKYSNKKTESSKLGEPEKLALELDSLIGPKFTSTYSNKVLTVKFDKLLNKDEKEKVLEGLKNLPGEKSFTSNKVLVVKYK